jgi:hypothetical protein
MFRGRMRSCVINTINIINSNLGNLRVGIRRIQASPDLPCRHSVSKVWIGCVRQDEISRLSTAVAWNTATNAVGRGPRREDMANHQSAAAR